MNQHTHRLVSIYRIMAVLVLGSSFLLAGCLDSDSSSGGSSSGDTAPSSIIGYKLVQTIDKAEVLETSGTATFLDRGDTLTYQFIDSTTILGEGLHTVPTTGWGYTANGNVADIWLQYTAGDVEDRLSFTSENGGTFTGIHTLYATAYHSQSRVRYTGTFRISGVDGGGSGGTDDSDDGSSTGSACETNNTGTLTAFVSNSQANGGVTLNVDGLGSRTTSHYFPSTAPSCGSTQTGVMTFSDVTAKSYSYSAHDQGPTMTWGPDSVTVPKCGCMLLELY